MLAVALSAAIGYVVPIGAGLRRTATSSLPGLLLMKFTCCAAVWVVMVSVFGCVPPRAAQCDMLQVLLGSRRS